MIKPPCESFTLTNLDPGTVVEFKLRAVSYSGELGPVIVAQRQTTHEGYISKVTFFPGTNEVKEKVVSPLHPQVQRTGNELMSQRQLELATGNV